MALQIRRGTEAERTASGGVVFAEGEIVYITDTDALYVGDGSTAGGVLLTNNALAIIGDYLEADTINTKLILNQDLDLNGNDIIGTGNINIDGTITATGNINIGDDANTDTVDFTAKITSTLTPQADSTYDIGTMSARWQTGYFTGLVVNGQVDAVSVNADVIADNSTVMVDVSANTFTGDLTGDVTGDVNGDVTGNVIGNVTGNTTGYHTGDVKGSVFGDDSTPIVDAVNNTLNGNVTGNVVGNVTGNVVGNVTGNVTGSVKGSGGGTVLSPNTGPADAELSVLNVTASGAISAATLSGNLFTGDVQGNTTGYHTGDVKGSVFADGSTLLVDAVAGTIPGENITGTITATFSGNLTGNVTGDLAGDVTATNIVTSTIDSADSSAITIVPATTFNAAINAEQEIQIGGINGVFIDDNQINAFSYTNPTTLTVNNIASDLDDYTSVVSVFNNTNFENDVVVYGKFNGFGERAISAQYRTQLSETNTGFFIVKYSGDPNDPDELQNIANYTEETKITETIADFATAVKFASMDDSTRNALTAEVGMVIFNTTSSKLQVCTGVSPTVWETITSV